MNTKKRMEAKNEFEKKNEKIVPTNLKKLKSKVDKLYVDKLLSILVDLRNLR